MQEITTHCFLALNNPKKYNATLYKNITSKNTPRFREKIKLTASKNENLFKQLQVNSLNTTNKTCTIKHLIPVAYTVKLYKQLYTTAKWQIQFFI